MSFGLGLFFILCGDTRVSCSAAGQTRNYLVLELGDLQTETVNMALNATEDVCWILV